MKYFDILQVMDTIRPFVFLQEEAQIVAPDPGEQAFIFLRQLEDYPSRYISEQQLVSFASSCGYTGIDPEDLCDSPAEAIHELTHRISFMVV